MIRLSVFMVLGPLTGYFIFVGLTGGFKGPDAGVIFGMLLPVAWIAGLAPAAITAGLDQLFERLGTRSVRRYLLTGVAGYASSYLFLIVNYFEVEPLFPFRYDWGLVGAIPAPRLCARW